MRGTPTHWPRRRRRHLLRMAVGTRPAITRGRGWSTLGGMARGRRRLRRGPRYRVACLLTRQTSRPQRRRPRLSHKRVGRRRHGNRDRMGDRPTLPRRRRPDARPRRVAVFPLVWARTRQRRRLAALARPPRESPETVHRLSFKRCHDDPENPRRTGRGIDLPPPPRRHVGRGRRRRAPTHRPRPR